MSAKPGRRRPLLFTTALVGALVGLLVGTAAAPAFATQPAHSVIVSALPSTATPNIADGRVLTIAKVGTRIIVGGTFTSVSNQSGGGTYPRSYLFAFNAVTGLVDTSFAPQINGVVNTLTPGPGDTVYAGGTFTTLNGATHRNLAFLNTVTGSVVPGFRAASLNGAVNDLALSGGRLYVGGVFSTAGTTARNGLVTLVPGTGAVDPYMTIDVMINHNYNGISGARAAVGVSKLDVSPDGQRLVIIGNFKRAEGEDRDQAAMILLNTGGPVVDPNWRTGRYVASCNTGAFDTYVRDVDFSPDGGYFAIVATGGPYPGTLCDTATRWNTADTGSDIEPQWIADTGGDTLFSVAITGTAIYVGGHQRWLNNAGGQDRAVAGAVPRPGLGALDPLNGVPLAWNPARQPRGVGAQALLATPEGLYVGSDTNYIGNVRYLRGKIAFFPVDGGQAPVSQSTGQLPSAVYLAGRESPLAGSTPGVLYRVNAAGPEIAAIDGGPAWAADNGGTSFHNGGNNTAGYPSGAAVDPTVPASTPATVFDTERWDPGVAGDGAEMSWAFPVAAGRQVEVRLYFANRCSCTSNPEARLFDVAIEGATVLDDFDIRASTLDQTGTMRSTTVTSDGSIDIDFGHVRENPLINAFEIIDLDAAGGPSSPPVGVDQIRTRYYDGSTVSRTLDVPNPDGLSWGSVRGGFVANGRLVYGYADGNLYTRTFDGSTFGPAVLVDPYNDPFWSNIATGSGQTYRGVVPTFYGQLPSVTGMAYLNGRVYYSRAGQGALFYRGMSLDSLIVADEHVVAGSSGWQDTAGMFVSGGQIYVASRTDGALRRTAFPDGVPTGPATVVSGPAVDGNNWSARALFLGPGDPPPPNQLPTASFTSSCTELACTFDATASTDDDGTVRGYAWSFGDGTTGAGATTSHAYPTAGTRTVVLTVTDDQGGTGTVSHVVAAGQVNTAPTASFTATCDGRVCSFDGTGSVDPDGTVVGYDWDFGDGTVGQGATIQHPYAAGGNYQVSLVVTDNAGATGSLSQAQSVASVQTVSFRAAATPVQQVKSATSSIVVPTTVRPGDALILVLSTNSAVSAPPPGGFTLVGTQTASTAMTTRVWQKVADAADPGRTVTVSLSASAKSSLGLVAYAGTASGAPASLTGAFDNGGTAHVTPTTTASAGSFVVSVWADKSAAARQFTAPGGLLTRSSSEAVGGGDVAVLIADGGDPLDAAGPVGGLTATVPVASMRATMVTIVLTPGS